jgi:hypothetical protein
MFIFIHLSVFSLLTASSRSRRQSFWFEAASAKPAQDELQQVRRQGKLNARAAFV